MLLKGIEKFRDMTNLWPIKVFKSFLHLYRHLPKLFDNLHHLEWKKDEAGKLTNVAVGMYSGEGEHVKFATECLCEGPAEVCSCFCNLRSCS